MLVAMEESDLLRISALLQNVDVSHVPELLRNADTSKAANAVLSTIYARRPHVSSVGRPAIHTKFPGLVDIVMDLQCTSDAVTPLAASASL